MAIEQRLTLRQRQQLTISPQLRQAIQLMQLSHSELVQELQSNCESNAMLELVEPSDNFTDDFDYEEPGVDRDTQEESEQEIFEQFGDVEPESTVEDFEDTNQALENDPSFNELVVASDPEIEWSESRESDYAPRSNEFDILSVKSVSTTLHDHLLEQLQFLGLSAQDELVAQYLIDNINDDGMLTDSLDVIARDLPPNVPANQLESVLFKIQSMSPTGVGARNLQECLHIQLQDLPEQTPGKLLALQLVEEGFSDLASRSYEKLTKKFRVGHDELNVALTTIQELNPRPGSRFSDVSTNYVVPDVFVKKVKGEWVVDVNDESIPTVRINKLYKELMRNMSSGPDKSLLREQFRNAKTFIDGLQQRNSTLLKTATAIVVEQQAFFEQGESAIKPLLQSDIARTIGCHESTVSRITAQKYLACPRGIFELKYFFATQLQTLRGREISSTAIKTMIKKLTQREDPAKPLSDSAIARLLRNEDIRIARRTVAKYREAMSIPSSTNR